MDAEDDTPHGIQEPEKINETQENQEEKNDISAENTQEVVHVR